MSFSNVSIHTIYTHTYVHSLTHLTDANISLTNKLKLKKVWSGLRVRYLYVLSGKKLQISQNFPGENLTRESPKIKHIKHITPPKGFQKMQLQVCFSQQEHSFHLILWLLRLLTSRQSVPRLGQRGFCGHLGSVHLGFWGWKGRLQCGSGGSRTHLR